MSAPATNALLTEDEVKKRLWQWAEVTALSLSLKEAAIRAEFPDLSDSAIQAKLKEQIARHRALNLPKE